MINQDERYIKVKSKDIYSSYKDNNDEMIIIIKEGIFYKTYDDDALLMWYLFDYVFKDRVVSFGNNSYDKVINKLKKIDINFMIVSKNEKVLDFVSDRNNYKVYLGLANISFAKKTQEELLVKKMKDILNKTDCYTEVNDFLDSIVNIG